MREPFQAPRWSGRWRRISMPAGNWRSIGQRPGGMKMSKKLERIIWEWSISSAEVFPAKTLAEPDRGQALRASALDYGLSLPASLARYSPVMSSWRTSQRCVLGGWIEYSGPWPRAGMMLSGTVYPLQPSAPRTCETGSSVSHGPHLAEYPTPSATDYGTSGNGTGNNTLSRVRPGLSTMARTGRWPTPIASSGGPGKNPKNPKGVYQGNPLATAAGGQLNPTWVEWLMGFPPGWTDLDV